MDPADLMPILALAIVVGSWQKTKKKEHNANERKGSSYIKVSWFQKRKEKLHIYFNSITIAQLHIFVAHQYLTTMNTFNRK